VGLSYTEVRQLLHAHRAGAAFGSVLTIGRQNLHLHPREIALLGGEFGLDLGGLAMPLGVYADDFLREVLGAERVDSMDASPHEGATIIHDLNVPIPVELHTAYDAVIDGGSLEHVFNVPVALANMMRAARPGGRLFTQWPANNLCGHGFFQFSPEFAFRAFSESAGFEAERVALVESRFPSVELSLRRLVLDVRDPDALGHRVLRMSLRPALLMVQAHKLRHLDEPFAVAPQQSDYSARWNAHAAGPGAADGVSDERAAWLPPAVRRVIVGGRQVARASRFNRRAYTRAP
jgi:SAM-dependent methyltransferase